MSKYRFPYPVKLVTELDRAVQQTLIDQLHTQTAFKSILVIPPDVLWGGNLVRLAGDSVRGPGRVLTKSDLVAETAAAPLNRGAPRNSAEPELNLSSRARSSAQ